MDANDSVMENFILDPRSEDDLWWATEYPEEPEWEAGSDSDGSIRSFVTDTDDSDGDESIPSLITPLQSTRSHSSSGRTSSNIVKKSAASSVYTSDSAYGSPVHQYETDTNISTTYATNQLSNVYSKTEENVIEAGPSRQCLVCDTTFFNAKKYEIHVRTHERLKKMVCPFCTVMHQNGEDFFRHLKTHESANLQCRVCLKKFNFQESLREHQRIHTRWRKCPFHSCKKLFRTAESYNQHMESHNINGEEVNASDRQSLKRKVASSCSSYSDDGISENFVCYQDSIKEEQEPVEEEFDENRNEIGETRSERALTLDQPINKKFNIDKSKKLTIKKKIKLTVNKQSMEHRKRIKPLI